MEIWSLTRFPEGEEPGKPTPPEAWECDDPRWPPIPAQDFSNLPRQQKGLHAKGFEYMRLSERARGTHLELRTDHRRLPRRPSLRAAAPGAAVGQRGSLRQADRRHRLLSMETTYAEVVEGIRATIAAYTQALDDGRTDDVVATFCPDGVCEIPGMGTHEGHDALRTAYAGWKPRGPSVTSSSTPSSPTGTTTRPTRSATWSSSCRATPAGRSRSWADTTTRSTTTTARGASTIGRASRLSSRRLVQQRPARQPRSTQRDHDRARPPAPRGRPVGTDVAVVNALRPHRLQGPLLRSQRVVAVEQARQHVGVAIDAHQHNRTRLLTRSTPSTTGGNRLPRSSACSSHGVRRLRHATKNAPGDQRRSRVSFPGSRDIG